VAPNRDVVTTNGMKLTLINPFRMTRQAYELLTEISPMSAINRTVSLHPLNPDNEPDEWERKALIEFEKGHGETSEITTINNEPYMRVLKPYITVEGCLKCHGFQGYKAGDIRGAMSIAVPMKPYYESEARTREIIVITHLLIWFAGIGGIVMLTQNIKKQQQRIEESERKFRTLSEFAHDWEYWVKEDMGIVFMSPSCEHITGYTQEEFLKNPQLLCDIVYPEDKAVCHVHMKDFRAPQHEEMEFRIITKDGQVKWLSHVCGPIYVDNKFLGRRVSNRDISDRKRLEEQLIQSQKMESLGLLAGGIAHDFNNLLTAITGYSSILKESLAESSENNKKYVQHVLNAAEKAQNLTSSLLAFSRKQIIKPSVIYLNEVIKGVSDILKRLIGEDIELRLNLSDIELPVFGDANQIEQIVMNLATNARDAMPGGGILSIETAIVALNQEYVDAYGAKPGKYMMISISDTGIGIDKKDMAHIFDPFYTTKEKGKGTGLGLSMVYGIIKQHDGFVNVYSEKNIGTTFKIYIPVTADMEDIRKEIVEHKPEHDFKGNETILIAEDEESVREFLKDILEVYGYKVYLASDGEDAIAKYNEHKDNIDMVILDVVMPKKNGKEVYSFIKDANPDIKAIFISGYTQDILTSKGIYEEGLEFIAKPLEIQRLMAKIRSILYNRS
jgi:PAS domain S-box-containing protein